jgi:hypothetical protein
LVVAAAFFAVRVTADAIFANAPAFFAVDFFPTFVPAFFFAMMRLLENQEMGDPRRNQRGDHTTFRRRIDRCNSVPQRGGGGHGLHSRIDPQKITSPAMIVEETLATVKQLEATGTYSNVKLYESADDGGAPSWSKGGFSARIDQDVVISLVYATIRGDYAVKARLTTANPKNDSIPKFVAEFQKIVNAAKPSP